MNMFWLSRSTQTYCSKPLKNPAICQMLEKPADSCRWNKSVQFGYPLGAVNPHADVFPNWIELFTDFLLLIKLCHSQRGWNGGGLKNTAVGSKSYGGFSQKFSHSAILQEEEESVARRRQLLSPWALPSAFYLPDLLFLGVLLRRYATSLWCHPKAKKLKSRL